MQLPPQLAGVTQADRLELPASDAQRSVRQPWERFITEVGCREPRKKLAGERPGERERADLIGVSFNGEARIRPPMTAQPVLVMTFGSARADEPEALSVEAGDRHFADQATIRRT